MIEDWFIEGTLPRRWAAPAATPTPLIQPQPIAISTTEPGANPSENTATRNTSHAIVVPDLIGVEENEARRIIADSGFNNTYPNYQTESDVPDKAFYDSIRPGHVISQMPAPGTEVGPGSTIFLAIRKT